MIKLSNCREQFDIHFSFSEMQIKDEKTNLLSSIIPNTPTTQFLKLRPLDEMKLFLIENAEESVPEFVKKLPFFLNIANQETKETFGYHGMSQKYRLFQDVLNIVFDIYLGMPLPDDFYLLRIPGEKLWNWKEGKESFLNHYEKKELSKDYTSHIISNFLLIVEKEFKKSIQLLDLSFEERLILEEYFQNHFEYQQLTSWNKTALKYSLPIGYDIKKPIFNKNVSAVIKLISIKANESKETIENWFSKRFSDDYDVSMLFYLRELHLDSSLTKEFFTDQFNDTESPQKEILMSLNTSVFSNYVDKGCFTGQIFIEGKSVLDGDSSLNNILQEFFIKIGLGDNLAGLVWDQGLTMLEKMGDGHGCLLQFFDISSLHGEKPYKQLDHDAYLCFRHGIPIQDLAPSKYIQGKYELSINRKDLELRMVINNTTNLNPHSRLRMKRYDGLSVENSKKILAEIRKMIEGAPKDEIKIQEYKRHIQSLWK